MIDFGTVRPGSTLYIPFATYDSNDPAQSATITGLATTDIEIYKDGSTTQRASDAGFSLLDTDGIDFDGITGIHGISVNLADNTDAGFYAAGSQYWIVVSSVTLDAGTINFIAATFRIGYPQALLNTTIATLASQTSFTLTNGPAEDDALNNMLCVIHDVASGVQMGQAVILDYTGATKTVTLAAGTTFTAAATDNFSVIGPAPLQPTTAGNKLDVTTNGEAGLDLNNVNVPAGAIPFLGIVDNGTAGTITATSLDTRAANPNGSIQAGMTLMAYGSNQGYWQSVLIDSVSGDTLNIAAWPLATPSGTVTYYVQGTPSGSPNLLPDVNVAQISGDATAANNCESFFDGTGYAGTGNTIPTVTTVNGLAANVITAASIATGAIDADALAADAGTEIFNAVVTSQLTESYAADNTAPTVAQALFLIQQMLTERSVASTTLTVKKLDGSTTAATFTLDSASAPTSVTRTT